MEPLLEVEAMLLRSQLPDLPLRAGTTLAARVAERTGRVGVIVLAGSPLVAELPDDVAAGDTLQLVLQQARADKVVFKLIRDDPAALQSDPLLSLPGGVAARVRVEERAGGAGQAGGEEASITLTYETESLGAVNLRLALVPGTVVAQAELRSGTPFELATAAADELRERLRFATGRSVEVQLRPRHDPLDVYA